MFEENIIVDQVSPDSLQGSTLSPMWAGMNMKGQKPLYNTPCESFEYITYAQKSQINAPADLFSKYRGLKVGLRFYLDILLHVQ